MNIIKNSQDLQRHIDALIVAQPIFAEALSVAGEYPPMRQGKAGFAGLVDIIVSQQISKSAANSILARFWQTIETSHANDPARVYSEWDIETKRACGLSRPKIRYLDGIAEASLAGALEPEHLAQMDNATLTKTLTALPGIGVWSAEIYALFTVCHGDIFPAGDLALQESWRRLAKLSERPNEKALREIAATWTPYRSAAARLLWHYYRGAPA